MIWARSPSTCHSTRATEHTPLELCPAAPSSAVPQVLFTTNGLRQTSSLIARARYAAIHQHLHFNPPVLGASFRCLVRCFRINDSHRSRRHDVPQRNAALLDEIRDHRL